MTTPEIRPLDPADEAAVAAVVAVRTAADEVDHPDGPASCPYAFQAGLTFPRTAIRSDHYLAGVGGEVVGHLEIEQSQRENLDNAVATLTVHPGWRRRGIGRALYHRLWERLDALGRRRCDSEVVSARPGGPARDGGGMAFAAALGAKPALEEIRSRLDVTAVDEDVLARMAAGAEAAGAGYQVVSWVGAVPEEYAADVAYLSSRMYTDAPMGDLDLEAPAAEVGRLREREAAHDAGRWTICGAGVVHRESGRLVGYTDVYSMYSSPWHAYQSMTLVDPQHRGHRLGMRIKLANLANARAALPGLRAIDTWNAEVNDHMVAINDALGFRPVDLVVMWQEDRRQ